MRRRLHIVPCCDNILIFKQGEHILVQLRVMDDHDAFTGLKSCCVKVLVAASRQKPLLFGYNAGNDVMPLAVDADGYIAFVMGPEITTELHGSYHAEVSITEAGSETVSESFGLFEVVKSKIRSLSM